VAHTCAVAHKGFWMSGRMMIQMNDGSQREIRPGDAFHALPGHDAWIRGVPCMMLFFASGAATYAKS